MDGGRGGPVPLQGRSLLRDGRLKVLESNQEIQIDEESRHRRNTNPPGTKILFP